MSFPNVSDLVATTIQKRSKKIANGVLAHNALLSKLQEGGRVKLVSGGTSILEELSFAENGNAGFYSGYDPLPVSPQDVISAAEYALKLAACPVIVSGEELLINSGPERMIDLVESRLEVAEDTMKNLITTSAYGTGVNFGGKELDGLGKAFPADPTTGVYGSIDPAVFTFWQSKVASGADDKDKILGAMNGLWAKLVRGSDRPDLIILSPTLWGRYVAAVQPLQRFSGSKEARVGFPSLKYMDDADVVLDNVSALTDKIGYFLNTKYLKFRPHKDRNFVALDPKKRYAVNQDAEVQILAFAGNITCSNRALQGRISGA